MLERIYYTCGEVAQRAGVETREVANDVTRQSGDRVFSPRSMARSCEISEPDLFRDYAGGRGQATTNQRFHLFRGNKDRLTFIPSYSA